MKQLNHTNIVKDPDTMICPLTRGDSEFSIRWTCKKRNQAYQNCPSALFTDMIGNLVQCQETRMELGWFMGEITMKVISGRYGRISGWVSMCVRERQLGQ